MYDYITAMLARLKQKQVHLSTKIACLNFNGIKYYTFLFVVKTDSVQ